MSCSMHSNCPHKHQRLFFLVTLQNSVFFPIAMQLERVSNSGSLSGSEAEAPPPPPWPSRDLPGIPEAACSPPDDPPPPTPGARGSAESEHTLPRSCSCFRPQQRPNQLETLGGGSGNSGKAAPLPSRVETRTHPVAVPDWRTGRAGGGRRRAQ